MRIDALMLHSQALMHDAFMHYVGQSSAMSDYQASLRQYLAYVMKERELSPTALAKQAGIASSTLTRFLNNEDHKFTLSNTTIEKIVTASGIGLGPFLDGGPKAEQRATLNQISSIYEGKGLVSGLVSGVEHELRAGAWIDREIYQQSKLKISIGLPPLHNESRFYAVVYDNHINDIASEGEFLYCLRYRKNAITKEEDGALWVVERTMENGSLIECSGRISKAVPGGVQFSLASSDPRHRAGTFTALSSEIDEGKVRIRGRAMSVVRTLIPVPDDI